ncbi:MAG: hypothetical protein AAF745_01590 [Planctomycetota bacterium]
MNNDLFVAVVAALLAIISVMVAAGPWLAPYQLRSMVCIQNQYGKSAARGVWLIIALVSGCSALAIMSGFRPSYAAPQTEPSSTYSSMTSWSPMRRLSWLRY